MVDLIQKQDLSVNSFSNDNTLAAGGVRVRTDAGSAVALAIDAAVATITTGKAAVYANDSTTLLGYLLPV